MSTQTYGVPRRWYDLFQYFLKHSNRKADTEETSWSHCIEQDNFTGNVQ